VQFGYQSEKLSDARANLMLPHTSGEAQSIAGAFHEIQLAFMDMDEKDLDDSARGWVRKLKEYLDVSDVEADSDTGLFAAKSANFSDDQKLEISNTVDELAHWFARRYWESTTGS
jgi:hypothetical protein